MTSWTADAASKKQLVKVKNIETATWSQKLRRGLQKFGKAVWWIPVRLRLVTPDAAAPALTIAYANTCNSKINETSVEHWINSSSIWRCTSTNSSIPAKVTWDNRLTISARWGDKLQDLLQSSGNFGTTGSEILRILCTRMGCQHGHHFKFGLADEAQMDANPRGLIS